MGIGLIFLTALVVGYSGAIAPGPMLTLVVAKSTEHGAWTGSAIAVGHLLLEALLLLGLAVGLTQVLSQPMVSNLIAVMGGLVLVFMGGSMVVRAARGRLSLDTTQAGDKRAVAIKGSWTSRRLLLRLVGLGALVSVSNPFVLLWWATIGSAYFLSARLYGLTGVLAFFAGHLVADLTWYGLIGCLCGYGRRFVGANVYRALNGVCGIALIVVAAYFIRRGVASF